MLKPPRPCFLFCSVAHKFIFMHTLSPIHFYRRCRCLTVPLYFSFIFSHTYYIYMREFFRPNGTQNRSLNRCIVTQLKFSAVAVRYPFFGFGKDLRQLNREKKRSGARPRNRAEVRGGLDTSICDEFPYCVWERARWC